MGFLRIISTLFLLSTLAACGGGSGSNGGINNNRPDAPSNTQVTSTDTGIITVTGTAEPNSTVTVIFPDGSTRSTEVSSDGLFSVTSNTPHYNGTITITSSDTDNNESAPATISFTDLIAPTAPTVTLVSSSDTGIATISGRAEVGSTVHVTFPDNTVQTAIIEGDGEFSLTSTISQPSGIFSITSTDDENNTSFATIATFINATTPNNLKVSATSNGILTVSGKAIPQSTVNVTFPDGSEKTIIADGDGDINFTVVSASGQVAKEISVVSNSSNGVTSETAYLLENDVIAALYNATGQLPDLGFEPSLGINTEAPQGGVDSAGTPIPFVDIFRTALPFNELSGADAEFDEFGWTTKLATGKTVARTKLLQGTRPGSIPNGTYSVLYDVTGTNAPTLEFNQRGPTVTNTTKVNGENKYTFDLNLQNFHSDIDEQAQVNAVLLNVRGIAPDSYVKNIRVIMPGGTCRNSQGEYNHFVRALSDADCPTGTLYVSFEERLTANRNEIIFNPDYLMFLRNFKVVRMMNLMEASLKDLCGGTNTHCPDGVGEWSHRANINDSVWGGNDGRTKPEDHKGVPIEVMIALANIIKKDIWINIPHVATDSYISNYAQKVFNDLDSSLKVYLEYSNEVWNSGFASFNYTTNEGLKNDDYKIIPDSFIPSFQDTPLEFKRLCDEERSTRCEDYFARLRFFSQRSVEIFDIWESYFGVNSVRLNKVLGSITTDRVLTDLMLDFIEEKYGSNNKVDSVAIAPYFYGCPYKINEPENNRYFCADAPKTLEEATSVDDVFDIINQNSDVDPKGIDGTLESVRQHTEVAKQRHVKLITYEGGQHLSTSVLRKETSTDDISRLKKLFDEANRDPRMKDIYVKFLQGWKSLHDDDQSTAIFTLYTMPQAYYRHGNFGIKEHLNKPRNESPKFDGIMTFQEDVQNCWWSYCNF